jgi:acylphosphatase
MVIGMESEHLNIRIFGQVQGVFFRDSAREKAEELGIAGFARNEPDGSVYIEAEGREGDLEQFLNWAKSGPDWAKVEKVESLPGGLKNFSSFVVK